MSSTNLGDTVRIRITFKNQEMILIEKAAMASGMSVPQFIIHSAVKAASK